MGEFDYDIDKHFWQFYLGSGERTIVVEEDTDGDGTVENSAQLTLGQGLYLNTITTATAAPFSRKGLLKEVEDQLNNSSTLSGSYSISAQTPPSHDLSHNNALTDAGIRIGENSGNVSGWFRINRNSNWTLNPRYLGWPDTSQNYTDQSEKGPEGNSNILNSPFSLLGQWQVHNLVRDAASDKRDRTVSDTRVSSGDAEQSRAQKFNEYPVRKFKYEILPGAMVREGRGHDKGSAKVAKTGWISPDSSTYSNRAWGENQNAWETLFLRMVEPRRSDGELRNVIVLHDDTGHELRTSNETMEHVRIRKEGSNSDLMDPGDFWDTTEPMGELHTVEWEVQRLNAWTYRQ